MSNKLILKILDKAIDDLDKIANYIALDNIIVASNLLKYFYTTFDTLSEYPKLGHKRPDFTDKDVYFYTVRKNYLILYKIQSDTLFILRVFASYQDICNLL